MLACVIPIYCHIAMRTLLLRSTGTCLETEWLNSTGMGEWAQVNFTVP